MFILASLAITCLAWPAWDELVWYAGAQNIIFGVYTCTHVPLVLLLGNQVETILVRFGIPQTSTRTTNPSLGLRLIMH